MMLRRAMLSLSSISFALALSAPAAGDLTDLRFSNLRIDVGVADDRFDLELPTTVDQRTVEADRHNGLH